MVKSINYQWCMNRLGWNVHSSNSIIAFNALSSWSLYSFYIYFYNAASYMEIPGYLILWAIDKLLSFKAGWKLGCSIEMLFLLGFFVAFKRMFLSCEFIVWIKISLRWKAFPKHWQTILHQVKFVLLPFSWEEEQ